jgi:GntR family transcriptional regulator / MocR family aminotransferase
VPESWASLDLHLNWTPTRRPAQALGDALRAAIRGGQLPPGAALPSTRALAGDLAVARGTVSAVYADLAAEGYLTIRHGAPTRVAAGVLARQRVADPAATAGEPAPRWTLSPSQPDVSAFPRVAWAAATRRIVTRVPAEALGYADPFGHPALRAALAGYLRRARGVLATPQQVIIGAGFAHLLAWWARVGKARGIADVSFEDPSLPALRAIVAASGLRLHGVEVDDDGLRVCDIDAPAVVVTPAHHYPLGVTLEPARRARLARRAVESGLLVLEDDYDGEFRFDRRPVGALQALAPDHIVYAGTTSKTLAPGLRLGWLVVPPRLAGEFREAVAVFGERHASVIDQLVLADLIETGAYDRHIRRMRAAYRRRRDRVLAAVNPALLPPAGIAAGLHLALRFPPGGPGDAAILEAARRHSLAVGLLRPTWIDPAGRPGGIVVGFAAPPEHAFGPALGALRATLADLGGRYAMLPDSRSAEASSEL